MYKHILFLISLLLLLAACHARRPLTDANPSALQLMPDTSRLVSFPAPVLYLLAREYESLTDSTKPKYHTPQGQYLRAQPDMTLERYMELRLIQLFPQVAYRGVLEKINRAASSLLQQNQSSLYIHTGEFNGIKAHAAEKTQAEITHPYHSEEDEIQFLNMIPSERNIYELLNSMADSAGFVRREDLENIQITDTAWNLNRPLLSDSIPFFLEENLAVSLLLSGMGSAIFYRIMQSKARAEYVAEHYYPGATKDGMRGDAFKHLFVNMMLRRYTSESLAWLIMDIYWERVGNNAPCDMVMDLHNNRVGRAERYWDFRGNKLTDAFNWKQWSQNILQFVEDTTSNATYQPWSKQLPLHYIQASEQNADPALYLYWNKATSAQQ